MGYNYRQTKGIEDKEEGEPEKIGSSQSDQIGVGRQSSHAPLGQHNDRERIGQEAEETCYRRGPAADDEENKQNEVFVMTGAQSIDRTVQHHRC